MAKTHVDATCGVAEGPKMRRIFMKKPAVACVIAVVVVAGISCSYMYFNPELPSFNAVALEMYNPFKSKSLDYLLHNANLTNPSEKEDVCNAVRRVVTACELCPRHDVQQPDDTSDDELHQPWYYDSNQFFLWAALGLIYSVTLAGGLVLVGLLIKFCRARKTKELRLGSNSTKVGASSRRPQHDNSSRPEDENSKLQSKLGMLPAENKQLQDAKDKLESKGPEISRLRKELASKNELVAKLTRENKQVPEISRLRKELASKNELVAKLTRENEQVPEISQLRKELASKNELVATLTRENKQIQPTSRGKSGKKDQSLVTENERMRNKLQKEEENVGKLKEELSRQRTENDTSRKRFEEEANGMKAALEEARQEIENLKCSLTEKEAAIEGAKKEIRQLKWDKHDLEAEVNNLEKDLQEKKRNCQRLKDQIAQVNAWISQYAALSCVMPQTAYEDERITPIMTKLMKQINGEMDDCAINIIPKPGAEIDNSNGLPILLPCIAASRVGSDISAALAKANVANGQVILLIFHHLAPHNCKINTPTEKRLSDRSLLDQCVGMVDAVFWQGDVFDCAANKAAIKRVQQLFRWSISLDDVQELKQRTCC